ncbi:UNVERIFIED_CONTAM: hypothetical protein RMT77_000954 [Armadillidium vulgare]
MKYNFLISFTLVFLVQYTTCLECYVCDEQETNQGKCTSTVIVCGNSEERCLSTIRWGSTPYWEIGAPMQYYISKMCATQEQCEEMHNQTIGLCDRIEWRDWFCAECCQGDRCNYYITLGSSSIRASLMVVLTSFLLAVIFNAVTS